MIPSQLGIIGFFRLCKFMGILDTFFPLILPGIANASTVFFIMQYMKFLFAGFSAGKRQDRGCNEFIIFNRIALPW